MFLHGVEKFRAVFGTTATDVKTPANKKKWLPVKKNCLFTFVFYLRCNLWQLKNIRRIQKIKGLLF